MPKSEDSKTPKPKPVRFTAYLEPDLVWAMRQAGMARKLYGDNDCLRVAVREWVAAQKKLKP